LTSASRRFPGFDAAYLVGDPVSPQAYRGDVELPPGFPHANLDLLLRGELRIEKPLVVRHEMGGAQPKDVVWTTSIAPFIVCQRVVEVLSVKEFTGWTTYPVEVYNRSGEVVEGCFPGAKASTSTLRAGTDRTCSCHPAAHCTCSASMA